MPHHLQKNDVFPSDIEQNTVKTTEAYKDSRECKSIIKSVIITFIVIISIPIFFFFAHRTINPHNGSKIADIIILITYTIIWKLFRSLFVIISSICCFEVIGALFSTMVTDIIDFFQLAFDRCIIYFWNIFLSRNLCVVLKWRIFRHPYQLIN